MAQKAYVTMLGRSTWALVNSFYALVRKRRYRPDAVLIIAEASAREEAERARRAIAAISAGYRFDPVIRMELVPDEDFRSAGRIAADRVSEYAAEGWETAIDITSGRRGMVAEAIIGLVKGAVHLNHIFYLSLAGDGETAAPYMEIPLKRQQIMDFSGGDER